VAHWKLKSWIRVATDNGERYQPFGEHPLGYIGYFADGRMYVIAMAGDRPTPHDAIPTDAAPGCTNYVRVRGAYTIDSDKITHDVDISANRAWNETDQVRHFKKEGNTLTIASTTCLMVERDIRGESESADPVSWRT